MAVTDTQVRKLMKEFEKDGQVGRAAMKAGMDRKTARRYLKSGELPSQQKKSRDWRTRADPFAGIWAEIELRLADAPELEAKTLFEDLLQRRPDDFHEGQLRTFQRRVKGWRATEGPDREVFFSQEHRPGEAMQTDFTHADCLEIIVGGQPFDHLLCDVVLPYSNWQWVTVCHSESIAALKHGVQEAVFRLGHVPKWHQTDNSTGATYRAGASKKEEQEQDGEAKASPGRRFHEGYLALMRHLGMKPRCTAVGKSEQNGDVEALNGALKRRLTQHLLLRGHRDFDTVEDYQRWLEGVCTQANRLRGPRLKTELDAMRPLVVERLPVYEEVDVKVTSWSTIRVKRNTYSVPSRLIGERVRVRVYEARLEVFYGQQRQLEMPRLRGEGGRHIDYRHIIWSLVRKPGAFERYKYREAMFPTLVFRRAYDALLARHGTDVRRADIAYLRILHLAASTTEREVAAALETLLDGEGLRDADQLKTMVGPEPVPTPTMEAPVVDLDAYDALLSGEVAR